MFGVLWKATVNNQLHYHALFTNKLLCITLVCGQSFQLPVYTVLYILNQHIGQSNSILSVQLHHQIKYMIWLVTWYIIWYGMMWHSVVSYRIISYYIWYDVARTKMQFTISRYLSDIYSPEDYLLCHMESIITIESSSSLPAHTSYIYYPGCVYTDLIMCWAWSEIPYTTIKIFYLKYSLTDTYRWLSVSLW